MSSLIEGNGMVRPLQVMAVVLAAAVSFGFGWAGGDDHGMGHGGGGHGSTKGENAPTVAGARRIAVSAKSFEFTPDEITIQAGEDVTIVLTSADVFHDFMVKGEGHVVGAKRGKTRRGGLRIDEPGTYKIWCSVSGHRSAGMKGTIVVQ